MSFCEGLRGSNLRSLTACLLARGGRAPRVVAASVVSCRHSVPAVVSVRSVSPRGQLPWQAGFSRSVACAGLPLCGSLGRSPRRGNPPPAPSLLRPACRGSCPGCRWQPRARPPLRVMFYNSVVQHVEKFAQLRKLPDLCSIKLKSHLI